MMELTIDGKSDRGCRLRAARRYADLRGDRPGLPDLLMLRVFALWLSCAFVGFLIALRLSF